VKLHYFFQNPKIGLFTFFELLRTFSRTMASHRVNPRKWNVP